MIFQHTWQKVLEGKKVVTRRPVNYEWYFAEDLPGVLLDYSTLYDKNGRRKYYVGQTLAVQPGRGKKAVGRIKILRLDVESVRCVDHDEAIREGFANRDAFIELWRQMHGDHDMALVIEFELVEADGD